MTTLIVTNNADAGTGSLRATLGAAQNGDVVTFSPTTFVDAVTDDIVLSSALFITKNVTIEGSVNGASVALDGGGATGILTIAPVATVSLDNLVIQNGFSTGLNGAAGGNDTPPGSGADAAGGILNRGKLTLSNIAFSNDIADGGIGGEGGVTYGSGDGGAAGGNAAGAVLNEPGARLTIGVNVSFAQTYGTGGAGGMGGTGRYNDSSGTAYAATGGAGGAGGVNGPGAPGDHGGYDNPTGIAYKYSGLGGPAGKAGYAGEGFSIYGQYQGYGAGGGGGGGTGFDTIGGPGLVACFVRGTLIRTEAGEIAVEVLAIGDRVMTHDGTAKPIRWIGRRAYAGRFLAGRGHLLPVRIRAGALGGGLPARDLLVSPMHAMFFEGVLVPSISLVNGQTIVQETVCPSVEYFHVELAAHDVIWAEGAATETFLDDDSRCVFHNWREFAELYPDAPGVGRSYAPRLADGVQVEAVRRRLGVIAAAA